MIRKSFGERIFNVFNIIFLFLLGIVFLLPMLHVLFASFSEPNLFAKHSGILLYPLGFTLKGYELMFKDGEITLGYINTINYVVLGTFISMMLTIFGAYVISRTKLMFGKAILLLMTFTMFFSGGLIPFFLLVKNLGMLDTIWANVLPSSVSVWNIIVMRTAFRDIPRSLEESAKIDGADDFTTLFRIILPLSKPVLAVIALFYIVGNWNSWFNAMIFLKSRELFPLQLFLREVLITNDTSVVKNISDMQSVHTDMYQFLVQYTTIVAATLPILAIYPFIQKYFVKGIMLGSVKG